MLGRSTAVAAYAPKPLPPCGLEGYDMPESDTPEHGKNSGAEWLAAAALLALLLYLLLVLAVDAAPALRFRNVMILFLAAAIGLPYAIRVAVRRGMLSRGTLVNLSLLSGTLTVSF